MAFSINKMSALGNIGTDLEVREAGSSSVLNFSIACNERFKKKGDDEYTEKTEWVRCVAWGKPAEIIAEYASKGSKIYIEGQLQTRKWDKDGVDQYTTEVNVREFVILDGKSGGSNSGSGSRPGADPQEGGVKDDDDGYPF
jgi:single-strand DNA-binding protein